MNTRVWIELATSLLVGSVFGLLLAVIAWYGFIVRSNERNSQTLTQIEASVMGVVQQNQEVINENHQMLMDIQESMEDRTKRLEEIKKLLEKR